MHVWRARTAQGGRCRHVGRLEETHAGSKAQADLPGHTGADPAWKTQANISPSKARDPPTITRHKNEPTKANANAEGRDRHTELIKTSGSANSERY